MATVFLGIAALLCLGAIVFFLYPLWREPPGAAAKRSRLEVNTEIYRDRLRELEQDLAQGTLSRSHYDRAVADLERDMAESGALDAERDGFASPERQRGQAMVAGVAGLIAVPLLATMLYLNVGYGEKAFDEGQSAASEMPDSGTASPGMGAGEHDEAEFRELAVQLRARLEERPEDVRGWQLLGRTLLYLERHEEASEAFEEAVARSGNDDPDLLVQYADVRAEVEGVPHGEARDLVERALEINPEHPNGLWLGGSLAMYAGDYDEAREHWERLLNVLPPGSDGAAMIRANLQELSESDDG